MKKLLSIAAIIFTIGNLSAQTNSFVSIPGIAGDSPLPIRSQHTGAPLPQNNVIVLASPFAWDISNPREPYSGPGPIKEAKSLKYKASFTCYPERAIVYSNGFLNSLCNTATVYPYFDIYEDVIINNTRHELRRYKLENVSIQQISLNAISGEVPQYTVDFLFTKYTYGQSVFNNVGAYESTIKVNWDFKLASSGTDGF